MASGTTSKCPRCNRSIAVGIVSGTLIQHEDKTGLRCDGSGKAPVVAAPRSSSGTRTRTAASGAGSTTAPKRTSPVTKGSLSVRKVEVDPEVARERAEKSERLRQERAEAARARNEVHVSYFDEPGA